MKLEQLVNGKYEETKHDNLIKELQNRLIKTGGYDIIRHNVPYFDKFKQVNGEMDLIARKYSDYLLIFEVKSSYSRKHDKKSRFQVNKDETFVDNHLDNNYRIFKFSVFGNKKSGMKIKRVI